MSIELACLDMAGTTVRDEGSVMVAFTAAILEIGLVPDSEPWHRAIQIVEQTMGQSKIEVFRRVVGDDAGADRANAAFERAYSAEVARGAVTPMPGAEQVLAGLRGHGVRICLTTGFSPSTRDAIIDSLGWHDRIDLALSPADVGRGRPWPDLILAAVIRLEVGALRSVVVVGDTPSDVESGVRAGAGTVVGVTSGAGRAEQLTEAGAHVVCPDITHLPADLFTSDHAARVTA